MSARSHSFYCKAMGFLDQISLLSHSLRFAGSQNVRLNTSAKSAPGFCNFPPPTQLFLIVVVLALCGSKNVGPKIILQWILQSTLQICGKHGNESKASLWISNESCIAQILEHLTVSFSAKLMLLSTLPLEVKQSQTQSISALPHYWLALAIVALVHLSLLCDVLLFIES